MDIDILPDWALNYLNQNVADFAHVVNALPMEGGPWRETFLVNTSRGAVMVRKSRFGEPEHWFLPLPGVQATFSCDTCDERMEFVDPEVPRPVFCSRCGAGHRLLVVDGALSMQPAEARVLTKPQGNTAYYDYKGDNHPVVEIEGIGPKWAERLRGLGIKTTARLAYEDAEALAKKLGASAKSVRAWQDMAQLVKISGIGPQFAEALVRGGVRDIPSLKRMEAKAIADRVNAYLDSLDVNVVGQRITARRVRGWQTKAQAMRKVRQPAPEA